MPNDFLTGRAKRVWLVPTYYNFVTKLNIHMCKFKISIFGRDKCHQYSCYTWT